MSIQFSGRKTGSAAILLLTGFLGWVDHVGWDDPSAPESVFKPAEVVIPQATIEPVSVPKASGTSLARPLSESLKPELGLVKQDAQRELHPVAGAIHNSQRLRLTLPGRASVDFSFRPFRLLAGEFVISLGPSNRFLKRCQAFEGRAWNAGEGTGRAVIVVVNSVASASISLPDGEQWLLQSRPGEDDWWALRDLHNQHHHFICQHDRATDSCTAHEPGFRKDAPGLDWKLAASAHLEPVPAAMTSTTGSGPMMKSSGKDPATGQYTMLLQPTPSSPEYETSLREATVLAVLDKSATGGIDETNLATKASQYLTLFANIATVYENQLGIRLLVQELIMTPDIGLYEDIPFGENGSTLELFQEWVRANRPASTYDFSMAIKFGAGLTGGTLGIAYQAALKNNNAVAVARPEFAWALASHEMGHNLGSAHSEGGIMNANYEVSNRTFFTDIEGAEYTAAMAIHQFSRNNLSGPLPMRDPAQIPFAIDDVAWTSPGEPVWVDVLANDLKYVPRGATNTLSLAEVGAVFPSNAGVAFVEEDRVQFIPAAEFNGTAWFSYSVRGDQGNGGRGWLHKGDVAVRVLGKLPDLFEVEIPAGGTVVMKLPGGNNISLITRPKKALIHPTISDVDVFVIRANESATGGESFSYRAGGKRHTLQITYQQASPHAIPDMVYMAGASGEVHFNPLLNDPGVGFRGTLWFNPVLGVGTPGEGRTGEDYFPEGFRLISAKNKTPNMGKLTLHRSPASVNGKKRSLPSGLLTFTAAPGSSGVAEVEYMVEDSLGNRKTGRSRIVIPGGMKLLVADDAVGRGWVPTGNSVDAEWTGLDFDDSKWKHGTNGAGYEQRSGYQNLVSSSFNFRFRLYGKNQSLYLRFPFQLDDPATVDGLFLRMKYDDGFIAYLNGTRIASGNSPETPQWNSGATENRSDSLAVEFESHDLSHLRHLLLPGKNVLALHGLNQGLNSSDMLVLTELAMAEKKDYIWLPVPICESPLQNSSRSITMLGRLFDARSQKVKLFFVWGKADGGADTSQWDHRAEVRLGTEGRASYEVSGLEPGTAFFYRLYAETKLGPSWAPFTQKVTTLPEGSVSTSADFYAIHASGLLEITDPDLGVFSNDGAGPEGLVAQLVSVPQHGDLLLKNDGTFHYTPAEGFTGNDLFLYRIQDALPMDATIVPLTAEWRFYDGSRSPGNKWNQPGFNDSGWSSGRAPLGYGNDNEATLITYGNNPDIKRATAYFRYYFDLETKPLVESVRFHLMRDDAAAVYLNGKEIYRDDNLAGNAGHRTFASSTILDETLFETFTIEPSLLEEGRNLLSAEVHQASRTSSDLSFALIARAKSQPGALVTIRVLPEPVGVEPLVLRVTRRLPFRFEFKTASGAVYVVEQSTDLRNWKPLKTLTGKGKPVEVEPSSEAVGERYFRVRIGR